MTLWGRHRIVQVSRVPPALKQHLAAIAVMLDFV